MPRTTRLHRTSAGFAALTVVGNLFPPEFLQTIAAQQAKHQAAADYGLTKSLVLKDELARYWRIANDLYASRSAQWLPSLLRDVFGYVDLAPVQLEHFGDRTFPITHRALARTVPFVLTTRDVSLDHADARFGDGGRARAPHSLLQDLLNADPSRPWGIVSNGTFLRLVRENPSLTRPAYLQADLERMFQEELYADFSGLWLAIHASRLAPVSGKPANCVFEAWRAQAQESGERALEHLRDGVTEALRALGNAFLEHPANENLRAELAAGSLSAESFFQELLRLVYRLLFLFTTEDRGLLHDPAATKDQREIYREGYSIARLRDRALRRRHYDRHSDLWEGLRILLRCLNEGAPPLGLPALGGLFASEQCVTLDTALVRNAPLLEAVRALAYFHSGASLVRVNYRDMGTEELGSVYESLLELHPYLEVESTPWTLQFVDQNEASTRGSARKLTGSYYTPASLVNELIKSVLEPVIAQTVSAHRENPCLALLGLRIIDPACGSGHFLLAAARRMAVEIARMEVLSETPDEPARQHALREVLQHCIYGVDRNPLTVELCRTALWIEAVEPGKPLTFLAPHIQWGDSLIGLLDPDIMTNGIPDEAYQELTCDDAATCGSLKQRNRRSSNGVQGELFDPASLKTVADVTAVLDTMPEDTAEEVAAKRETWEAARNAEGRRRAVLRADLFVGAFFAPKTTDTLYRVPITEDLHRLDRGMVMRAGVESFVAELAERHRFFHWNIEFADTMQRGGFDVILSNPPWERVKLQEQEFFATRSPGIANASTKAERESQIAALGAANASVADEMLNQSFQDAKHESDAVSQFLRLSARFPLTGLGDINTYAVFAETCLALTSPRGRAGLIVPTGIATEDTNKRFFSSIVSSNRLVSLMSFYEIRLIFRDTDSRSPFCVLTLRGESSTDNDKALFAFALKTADEARVTERTFTLSAADLSLLSPNTRTCPIFRSRRDAELTRGIYARTPVLINEPREVNDWEVGSSKTFHMSSASNKFRVRDWLEARGATLVGNTFILDGETWQPLYEAKMFYQFDHRYGSFQGVVDRGNTQLPRPDTREYRNAWYLALPWYWVPAADVRATLRNWHRSWVIAFRDVTKAASERTTIACLLPAVGVGNSASLLMSGKAAESAALGGCLLGNLNALVFDYCSRQKVSGSHLNFHFAKQLPVLPPSGYLMHDITFLLPRIAELCVTSWDLQCFADDVWASADESLRGAIERQWCENSRMGNGGHDGPPAWYRRAEVSFPRAPFAWNEERRSRLRAELDAYYAHLYGLSRDDLRYILDPADVCGKDYPSETFRVLKEREIKELGEYRTARLVLDAWDRLSRDGTLARIGQAHDVAPFPVR